MAGLDVASGTVDYPKKVNLQPALCLLNLVPLFFSLFFFIKYFYQASYLFRFLRLWFCSVDYLNIHLTPPPQPLMKFLWMSKDNAQLVKQPGSSLSPMLIPSAGSFQTWTFYLQCWPLPPYFVWLDSLTLQVSTDTVISYRIYRGVCPL